MKSNPSANSQESKTYRISQFAASVSAIPLFEIEGSDLVEMRVEAAKKVEALSKAGVPLLPCFYCEAEILPDTLANRAEFGKGQSARKARRLMRSGRYADGMTKQDALNSVGELANAVKNHVLVANGMKRGKHAPAKELRAARVIVDALSVEYVTDAELENALNW